MAQKKISCSITNKDLCNTYISACWYTTCMVYIYLSYLLATYYCFNIFILMLLF